MMQYADVYTMAIPCQHGGLQKESNGIYFDKQMVGIYPRALFIAPENREKDA